MEEQIEIAKRIIQAGAVFSPEHLPQSRLDRLGLFRRKAALCNSRENAVDESQENSRVFNGKTRQ